LEIEPDGNRRSNEKQLFGLTSSHRLDAIQTRAKPPKGGDAKSPV
jgi:hypothetical protein